MKCQRARDLLTAGPANQPGRLDDHLAGCPSCRLFAERMSAVRRELRSHHTAVEPDGAFSARVLSRLPGSGRERATDLLGWAALRLLPVAVVLALLLGGWSLAASPSPQTLLSSVDQDPIAWALGDEANP
ncbi:MAG: hypothetical protein KDD47_22470 [Acidobacteria bacterium]|nr:hypothetical protein [Acidobacteriota bacterium]